MFDMARRESFAASGVSSSRGARALQGKDPMNVALRRAGHAGLSPSLDGSPTLATAVRPEVASLMAVMLRLIDQHGSVVVYFTAVSHGAGTSTVVRELAIAAARSDWCKVALVDASVPAGTPNAPLGLLDTPNDGDDLPLRPVWHGEAAFMEGVLTGANNALPSVEAVRAVFNRLRQRFTLVVVDSPPLFMARHAAAFSAAADCVVLVVEAERTRAGDLERARVTLEQLGATILGIVLNKRRSWVPGRLSRLIWGETP